MTALRVFLATIVATVCGVAGGSGLSTFAAVTDQPDALSGARGTTSAGSRCGSPTSRTRVRVMAGRS